MKTLLAGLIVGWGFWDVIRSPKKHSHRRVVPIPNPGSPLWRIRRELEQSYDIPYGVCTSSDLIADLAILELRRARNLDRNLDSKTGTGVD